MSIQFLFRITLFILGLVLFLDGLVLIFQNKIHLGTLLPFVIGLIFCTQALFQTEIKKFLSAHKTLKNIWMIGWAAFSIWCISLILFFGYLKTNNTVHHSVKNIDAIIVLGSGLIQGQPSPTLASRLDKAAEISKSYPKAIIIVSGGLDYGEKQTEAEAMSNYLQTKFKINSSKINMEDQSTSTALNLSNSRIILEEKNLSLNSSIAIVTSDFHTLRATAIAHKQGYKNITSFGASTPLATRYNAWLREYFAYFSGWLLNEY